MPEQCAHEWKWVPAVIRDISWRNEMSYNVICRKCRRREWAHGRNPCR